MLEVQVQWLRAILQAFFNYYEIYYSNLALEVIKKASELSMHVFSYPNWIRDEYKLVSLGI